MSKLDTEKMLPDKPLQDGDKVSTVKKYVNKDMFILNWLLHESIDHRKVTIDSDVNWDDLKDYSSYYFVSLDGPNAPSENQLGSHEGIVICLSAGTGNHFQVVFTKTGACFRDINNSWFYIGHGLPMNIDSSQLLDMENLKDTLKNYFTQSQVHHLINLVYKYVANQYYSKQQIDSSVSSQEYKSGILAGRIKATATSARAWTNSNANKINDIISVQQADEQSYQNKENQLSSQMNHQTDYSSLINKDSSQLSLGIQQNTTAISSLNTSYKSLSTDNNHHTTSLSSLSTSIDKLSTSADSDDSATNKALNSFKASTKTSFDGLNNKLNNLPSSSASSNNTLTLSSAYTMSLTQATSSDIPLSSTVYSNPNSLISSNASDIGAAFMNIRDLNVQANSYYSDANSYTDSATRKALTTVHQKLQQVSDNLKNNINQSTDVLKGLITNTPWGIALGYVYLICTYPVDNNIVGIFLVKNNDNVNEEALNSSNTTNLLPLNDSGYYFPQSFTGKYGIQWTFEDSSPSVSFEISDLIQTCICYPLDDSDTAGSEIARNSNDIMNAAITSIADSVAKSDIAKNTNK